MTTYKFAVVLLNDLRSGKCSACGQRMRRTYKFEQTINPFNLKADKKTPKTRADILVELQVERDAAALIPIIHVACEKEAARTAPAKAS